MTPIHGNLQKTQMAEGPTKQAQTGRFWSRITSIFYRYFSGDEQTTMPALNKKAKIDSPSASSATQKTSSYETVHLISKDRLEQPAVESARQKTIDSIRTNARVTRIFSHALPFCSDVANTIREYADLQNSHGCFPFEIFPEEKLEEILSILLKSLHESYKYVSDYDALSSTLSCSIDPSTHLISPSSLKLLQDVVHACPSHVIVHTLKNLYQNCSTSNQNGYLLLSLLHLALNSPLPMPTKGIYSLEEVQKEMCSIVAAVDFEALYKLPKEFSRVIELFVFNLNFLLYFGTNDIVNAVGRGLCGIPFYLWRNKGLSLATFLTFLNTSGRSNMASALKTAGSDLQTRKVGMCFESLFRASSLTQAAPFYNQVRTFLPDVKSDQFSEICGHQFIPFLKEYTCKDPSFAKRVNVNCNKSSVMISNSTMIGAHEENMKGFRIIRINAYNIPTGDLLWGEEIEKKQISETLDLLSCELTSFGIVIIHANARHLRVFHPETGRESRVLLPITLRHRNTVHITDTGFCYLIDSTEGTKKLYGGNIGSGRWDQQFVINCSCGTRSLLGNCLHFDRPAFEERRDTIVDPTGTTHEVPNAQRMVRNGQVYEALHGTSADSGTILRILPLDFWRHPTAHPLHEMRLADQLTLVEVCHNGLCICKFYDRYFFIDIVKRACYPIDQRIREGSVKYVDKHHTALWTWNDSDRIVWVHTMNGSHRKEALSSSRGTNFHFVDEDQNLYYSDGLF